MQPHLVGPVSLQGVTAASGQQLVDDAGSEGPTEWQQLPAQTHKTGHQAKRGIALSPWCCLLHAASVLPEIGIFVNLFFGSWWTVAQRLVQAYYVVYTVTATAQPGHWEVCPPPTSTHDSSRKAIGTYTAAGHVT